MRNAARSMDLFRKLPDDLQLGTRSGGIISVVSMVFIVILATLEFGSYVRDETISSVALDEYQEDTLWINFNISMLAIPCQFASIDVSDHMGQSFRNVTKNIRKWRMTTTDGIPRRLEEVVLPAAVYVHHRYNGQEFSELLTEKTFEEFMKKYDMVLVNYHAPWCQFCKMLAPVWEHVANLLEEHPEFTEKVKLAKVDCTRADSSSLCRRAHVAAFPTILIYLGGMTNTRYTYNGPRSPGVIMAFIEIFYKHLHPQGASRRLETTNYEVLVGDIDQSHVSTHDPEGCQVAGTVRVQRVPGSFLLTARSTGHSFNFAGINVTHEIHHLSHGRSDTVLEAAQEVVQGRSKLAPLDGMLFGARNENITIEHYMKIVGVDYVTRYETLRRYKFSVNSNQYNATGEMPSAKFTYDISPLVLQVRSRHIPMYKFVTSLCAIIGGVFTVLGLVDSGVFHVSSTWRKNRIGKLD